MSESGLEWVSTTTNSAHNLIKRALVGGYEGYDGSALWVIRAKYEGDLVPGKLAVKHQAAFVPWGGKENAVHDIEVCCVQPEKIQWVEARDGTTKPQQDVHVIWRKGGVPYRLRSIVHDLENVVSSEVARPIQKL